jgi:hypothetical protein
MFIPWTVMKRLYRTVLDFLPSARDYMERRLLMMLTQQCQYLWSNIEFATLNSVIYKEENVYGDRSINDYMKDNAQNQLLEAERKKKKIRDFESDMWNY